MRLYYLIDLSRHQVLRFRQDPAQRHPHNVNPLRSQTHTTMDVILTDILFTLARAGVATLLAKELYSVTVPALLAFSIITYAALTRDPIRVSLPPYIGFKAVWDVFRGKRIRHSDARGLVRLSVFRRDVFWIFNADIMNDLLTSERIVPVFYGNGIVIEYGDKEKDAVKKVVDIHFGVTDLGLSFWESCHVL